VLLDKPRRASDAADLFQIVEKAGRVRFGDGQQLGDERVKPAAR